MIIPDDFYKLTLEHFAKTYPGLTLFAVWESKTVNGILETRVHLFDVERDEKLPIYTVSIHPRDLIFALLGETIVSSAASCGWMPSSPAAGCWSGTSS